MTAPAAAPASGPIAAPPPRAAPQPPAAPHAFAAVLDSLPGGGPGASTAEEKPRPSGEKRLDPPPGKKPGHSLPGDGSLLASLPFGLPAAPAIGGGPAGRAPSLAPPATKKLEPEVSAASVAAGAKTAATLGRLVGERTFHFGASATAARLTGGMLAIDSRFAPAASSASVVSSGPAAHPGGAALAASLPATEAAPIAPRQGKPAANRVSTVRPANEAARSGPGQEATAPPPAERIAPSAATRPPAESSGDGRTADGRPPDPPASAAPSLPQAGPFGAPVPAAFGAAAFAPDGWAARGADIAPSAGAPVAGPVSTAPPVREIDVDLSPGGLEDVSMTMRLAGDRLSVVVRAASSQTLSSIEGARDAIADRLAAIGQPLDSLIIKQTGVKADGTTGNAASADDGSAGDIWRPAQGAGERGGANDALSRRGAHRDRSF